MPGCFNNKVPYYCRMTLAQNLYLESMVFIPTTFTVAIVNLIPVFTFILAVCFRQEKLGLRSLQGIAKLAGTLVGIGGAMLFVFYKGITINVWHHTGLLAMPQSSTSSSNPHHSNGYVLGAVLALLSCLSTSAWLIIQVCVLDDGPFVFTIIIKWLDGF